MDLKKLAEWSWKDSILPHSSPIFIRIIKDPPLLLAESGGSFDSLRAGTALFVACVVCIFVCNFPVFQCFPTVRRRPVRRAAYLLHFHL